jgi:Ser/Thr protein kinase RdoA (MazF antagonist)
VPGGIAARADADAIELADLTKAGQGPAAGLVHGMGKELVEPDWAPLTADEVSAVLSGYDMPTGNDVAASAPAHPATPHTGTVVAWSSPRPMSAAGLVRRSTGTVFVKRHHVRVRSASQLAAEHAFATHLRASGLPVPAVWRTPAGRTVVREGDFVYEVHQVAPGIDLYRDAMSWTPYLSTGHARAAGAALARLHQAAAGFTRAARPPAVLTSSCDVITAADPLAEVDAIARRRPGLARYLAGRDWRGDLAREHLPVIRRAAPLLAGLEPLWGHGDWHPSNLTWDSAGPDAEVVAVFDLGLANRTFAVHDLAIALERSTIGWLDLAETGQAGVDTGGMDALLDGYQAVRPLSPAEASALPEMLPVVHLEYALSEVEYFADVVSSPALADLAYDAYLIGHTRWFAGPDGAAMLDHLRQREPVS